MTGLGKPNRTATASLVFRQGSDDVEAGVFKQCPILGGIKAGVIQGFPFKASHGLAMGGSAREHQRGTGCGVRPEYREHSSLILVAQVEETVPGENAVKSSPER